MIKPVALTLVAVACFAAWIIDEETLGIYKEKTK
jgi:hypothetical protein